MNRFPVEMTAEVLRHALRLSRSAEELALPLMLLNHSAAVQTPPRNASLLLVCKQWYILGLPFLLESIYFNGQESIDFDGMDIEETGRTGRVLKCEEEKDEMVQELATVLKRCSRIRPLTVERIVIRIANEAQARSASEIFELCRDSVKELSWSFAPVDSEDELREIVKPALLQMTPLSIWLRCDGDESDTDEGPIIRAWTAAGLQRLVVQSDQVDDQSEHWMRHLKVPFVKMINVLGPDDETVIAIAYNEGVKQIELVMAAVKVDGRWAADEMTDTLNNYVEKEFREKVIIIRPTEIEARYPDAMNVDYFGNAY